MPLIAHNLLQAIDLLGAAAGNFAVNNSHAYTASGTYDVQVTITDAGGATVLAVSTAQVAAVLAGHHTY